MVSSSNILLANFQVTRKTFYNFQNMLVFAWTTFILCYWVSPVYSLKRQFKHHLCFEVFSGPVGPCYSVWSMDQHHQHHLGAC